MLALPDTTKALARVCPWLVLAVGCGEAPSDPVGSSQLALGGGSAPQVFVRPLFSHVYRDRPLELTLRLSSAHGPADVEYCVAELTGSLGYSDLRRDDGRLRALPGCDRWAPITSLISGWGTRLEGEVVGRVAPAHFLDDPRANYFELRVRYRGGDGATGTSEPWRVYGPDEVPRTQGKFDDYVSVHQTAQRRSDGEPRVGFRDQWAPDPSLDGHLETRLEYRSNADCLPVLGRTVAQASMKQRFFIPPGTLGIALQTNKGARQIHHILSLRLGRPLDRTLAEQPVEQAGSNLLYLLSRTGEPSPAAPYVLGVSHTPEIDATKSLSLGSSHARSFPTQRGQWVFMEMGQLTPTEFCMHHKSVFITLWVDTETYRSWYRGMATEDWDASGDPSYRPSVAAFDETYTLDIGVSSGDGHVSAPSWHYCSGQSVCRVPAGETVPLTAHGASRATWDGCSASFERVCLAEMTSNRSVRASFGGEPSKRYGADAAEKVTLKVALGAGAGAGRVVSLSESYSAAHPRRNIDCAPKCSKDYQTTTLALKPGARTTTRAPKTLYDVVLQGKPDAGYVVERWEGCDVSFADLCIVQLADNREVTAHFEVGQATATSDEQAQRSDAEWDDEEFPAETAWLRVDPDDAAEADDAPAEGAKIGGTCAVGGVRGVRRIVGLPFITIVLLGLVAKRRRIRLPSGGGGLADPGAPGVGAGRRGSARRDRRASCETARRHPVAARVALRPLRDL